MTYPELWRRLAKTYGDGEAKAISRWLLEARFGLSATDIYCGRLEQLGASELEELEELVQRLEKSEPVQYVLGTADFCGRAFHVESGVLIPRPETAELCQWIIENEKHDRRHEACRMLDIGTGSGCIAITLALDIAQAAVTAWDISQKALRIANDNAKALGADVAFERCDVLDEALLRCNPPHPVWDVIVSNPPYIDEAAERAAMDRNVLVYEPPEALFGPAGEPDLFYRRIGDYAIRSLRQGGNLYFELNPRMADSTVAYLYKNGFRDVEVRQDQFGKPRMLKATKP